MLTLPETRSTTAPQREDDQWFKSPGYREDPKFDQDCMKALVALGIGEHPCPIAPEWISFSFVGAIVTALTGKYLAPPQKGNDHWRTSPERVLWGVLWETVEEHKRVFDRDFLASTLRNFIPRMHHVPPNRPWHESRFENCWRGPFGNPLADTVAGPIGNLRISCLRDGEETILELAEPVQESIQKIAEHVPQMLYITIEHIRMMNIR